MMQTQLSQQRQSAPQELSSSSDPADPPCDRSGCARGSAPPSRGKLLLRCFLQGLKAGLSEGTGESGSSRDTAQKRRGFEASVVFSLQMLDIGWLCSFCNQSGSTCPR